MSSVSFFTHRAFDYSELSSSCFKPPLSVQTIFQPMVPRSRLWETVAQTRNPKVIFWYCGANGFKAEGVRYHREDFRQIRSMRNGAECVLYDLTAWAALRKQQKVTLGFSNPNVERINALSVDGIRASASSQFFQWLKQLDGKQVDYLQQIVLQRSFIYAKSEGRYNGLKIEKAFQRQCRALEPLYKKDAANCYSALQYLEALYLVCQLAGEEFAKGSAEANLIFALPNDEWEYYFDAENSFARDAKRMLELEWNLNNHRVNIEFCTFVYDQDRPYNAGKEEVEQIAASDLV